MQASGACNGGSGATLSRCSLLPHLGEGWQHPAAPSCQMKGPSYGRSLGWITPVLRTAFDSAHSTPPSGVSLSGGCQWFRRVDRG